MDLKLPWFTSDLHLDHDMVIVYAKRPFLGADGKPDVERMNETLISNWNALVKPDDTIYVLGDLSCKSTPERLYDHIIRLNGKKHWIFGNHDRKMRKSGRLLGLFESTADLTEIQIHWDPASKNKNQRIVLCHYAMRVWNKSHYGAWQLFGHSHGNLKDDPHALQLDVGVDLWDFKPVSFQQLQERMRTKSFKPVDHHGVWVPSPDSAKCEKCGAVNDSDAKNCGHCGVEEWK